MSKTTTFYAWALKRNETGEWIAFEDGRVDLHRKDFAMRLASSNRGFDAVRVRVTVAVIEDPL